MKKMLVVYYSWSNGNTKRIAEQLTNGTGADIARIETTEPYSGSHEDVVEQGKREVEAGFMPQINPISVNLADYDVIAIGTPTWWYTMAPAVLTFLTTNDFTGKTVIPFMTNGGWPGHVIKDMEENCKGAAFAHEMQIQFDSKGKDHLETSEEVITEWIGQINTDIITIRRDKTMRKNFGAKPFLYPQPVMILGTYDENGKANAMNAAWGGIVGANEVIVDLSAHKTTDNIIKNKAFTVGVADLEHLVACDYVGIVSANKEAYKMQKAGFTTTKGEFVNAPIINELPLTLECELVKVIDGSKYLAEIKNVSADEKYLGDDGEIDLSKFTPITYDPVHHGYYRLGERVGNAFKDGAKLK